jgi:diamine N-acetyltransferase
MTIQLREITKADIPQINAWRNDPEVIDFLGCGFLYISEEIDEKWYQNYLGNRDKNVRLAITTVDHQFIGNVYLLNIHPINRTAEFSIVISDKRYWSQGIGAEVARRVLHHAFQDLNLNRVYLYVLNNNDRAIRLYEKIGFRREGRMEEAVYKNGAYHDLLLMAVLKRQHYNGSAHA